MKFTSGLSPQLVDDQRPLQPRPQIRLARGDIEILRQGTRELLLSQEDLDCVPRCIFTTMLPTNRSPLSV